MYDYVIVTHIPAFYKVNLYNELAKYLNIYVIFISDNTIEHRGKGFSCKSEEYQFEYLILSRGTFQYRKKFSSSYKLSRLLAKLSFKWLLVNGWDLPEFWIAIFTHVKSFNALALESSVIESQSKGIKGLIKRIFLSRVSKVFASGRAHELLLRELGFKGEVKNTRGVGLINKPTTELPRKDFEKKYLFVGRLVEVKNIFFLIRVFNTLSEYTLTIVGSGPLRDHLKKIANSNIKFIETVDVNYMKDIYYQHDILVLPSLSEPWGLVVEEALHFGLPVVVSKNCGAAELIINEKNGVIFDPQNENSLIEAVKRIDDVAFSNFSKAVLMCSIENKDEFQVKAYL